MKVLRANKDSLMNVLETFLHDPLVEWIKKQDEVTVICSLLYLWRSHLEIPNVRC